MSAVAPPPPGFRLPGALRAVWGGAVGSLGALAIVLTLGLLAWAPLGDAAVRLGLQSAFAAVAVGGAVYALLGRSAVPAAGPSSATTLILAALVVRLVAGPPGADGTVPAAGALLAVVGLAVAGGGLLQVLLAASGLARLVRHVPLPVLAGFMNGVALLILLGQLPLLMGRLPGAAPLVLQPGALALGLATAALMWALTRRRGRLPAGLTAMLAGSAAYALLAALWPALALGERIGAPAAAFALPPLLLPAFDAQAAALLQAHGGAVLGTALMLALIGSLESALSLLAMDQQLVARHEPRRELMALGAANIAAGLCGGLPVIFSRARAIAITDAAMVTSRIGVLAGSLLLGALFLWGGALLGLLPLAVLAGTMLVLAVGLVDRWSGFLLRRALRGEASRDLWTGLAVMALVCVATLWQGFPAGVALGLVLSMVAFVERMSRSLVRVRSDAAARPSRRLYPAATEARLAPLRRQVAVFELEGALFFGSGEQLLAEADRLGPDCRCLVLDLQRVGAIDETGAATLQLLAQRLARRGVALLPAGLREDSPAARALAEFATLGPLWPDADRATEEAERRLLGDAAAGAGAVALSETALAHGLTPPQLARLGALLLPLRLADGAMLFDRGDPGDALYLLVGGSVSIHGPAGPEGRAQRYVSFSPGVMLGEMAMLDGAGRSAAAVADGEAALLRLDGATLRRLTEDEPALAAALYRNIAVHLSERLRAAALRGEGI
jgi:SulP family sulfate permease